LVEGYSADAFFIGKGELKLAAPVRGYETDPSGIEKRSFELIKDALSSYAIDPSLMDIAVRVVHAGADFTLANLLEAGNGALNAAKSALRRGGVIFCDVGMLESGISRRECKRLNLTPRTFIHDGDVKAASSREGVTRAMASVDKALEEGVRIFAFGNAPTALFRLLERAAEGRAVDFVCGMTVGFVGAAESKARLAASGIPSVTLRGPRGGSGLCAACVNALLRMV
jgi:precorrin-8X/cobalt-precorrin-8 methylmutase